MKTEKTSSRVASKASEVLRDKHATKMEKSAAASALTQAPDHKKNHTASAHKKTTC